MRSMRQYYCYEYNANKISLLFDWFKFDLIAKREHKKNIISELNKTN
jgi:hypothetical protein